MSYLRIKYARAIEECLGNWGEIHSSPSETQTEAPWKIVSRYRPGLSMYARFVEDWIQIHTDTGEAAGSARILSALRWNGGLDGTARFALNHPGRSIGVRAELPLDGEVNIMPGLMAAMRGFNRAGALIHDAPGNDSPPESADEELPQESPQPLPQLLAEADWPFTERSEGSCMVTLDTKGEFHQAFTETGPDGGRRASVEIAAWENPSPASLNALALLLLTASDAIRMARPVIEDFGDRIAARFEVCFLSHAGPALLDHGLASLSVACRHCCREAAVLNNPRIAEEYLAVRHFNNE